MLTGDTGIRLVDRESGVRLRSGASASGGKTTTGTTSGNTTTTPAGGSVTTPSTVLDQTAVVANKAATAFAPIIKLGLLLLAAWIVYKLAKKFLKK